jgi:hypothetical protein
MRKAVNMKSTNMSDKTPSRTKKPIVGLFQRGGLRGFERRNKKAQVTRVSRAPPFEGETVMTLFERRNGRDVWTVRWAALFE